MLRLRDAVVSRRVLDDPNFSASQIRPEAMLEGAYCTCFSSVDRMVDVCVICQLPTVV